ncbi:hypothetical protein [Amycolatopsis sp. NPDC054798]
MLPELLVEPLGQPTDPDTAELSAYYGSIYPAIWSSQLALRTHGLASSLCSYHLGGREADVARILGRPDDVVQIGLLAVAYSTQREFSPAARPAVEDILYFDGWAKR